MAKCLPGLINWPGKTIKGDSRMEKSASFARYSKGLCWVVAIISLILAVLTFTGDAEAAVLRGLLWLALALVFAVSAVFFPRASKQDPSD